MKHNVAHRMLQSTILLLISSTVNAASADNVFDGFYLGASVGGTATSVKQDQFHALDVNLGGLGLNNLSVQRHGPNSQKNNNSFKGALFAGYSQTWDRVYLGAEAFVDLAHYRTHNSAQVDMFAIGLAPLEILDQTHVKLNSVQFGADLRPGMLLTPDSLLYGRVGVAFTDLTLESNGGLGFQNILLLALYESDEKDVAALRLGAGLEQKICPKMSVRLDYIYTYYGKQSTSGRAFLPNLGDFIDVRDQTSVKVYNNTTMLGFSYSI